MTREAIHMHIGLIEDRLRDLRQRQSMTREQFLADRVCQAAVEHWLIQAIESCIQIGTAILALRKLPASDTYKDVFRILYRRGVIPEKLQERLVAMVGFRNLAVHLYWNIEPEQAYAILHTGPDDIEEFLKVASTILSEQ